LPDQFDYWLAAFGHSHFDNVKAEEDVGVVEHAQPRERTAGDPLLLLLADCFERATEVFARAGFHFNEDERVAVTTNDVDLAAAAAAEVSVENLETLAAQITAGELLAGRAAGEMLAVERDKRFRQRAVAEAMFRMMPALIATTR
jgi:hypothetical protein